MMSGSAAAATLSKDAAALMRGELDALRGELAESARHLSGGALMAGASGVTGVLALAAAHQAILQLLESVMPAPVAAAVLALGYVAVGAALVMVARKKLQAAADAAAPGDRGSEDDEAA
jgi:Putative Actinobacterial Holin-X, holin superfamily III